MDKNLIDELDDFRLENYDFQVGLKSKIFKLYLTKELYYTIKIFDSQDAMLKDSGDDDFVGIHIPNDKYYSNDGKFLRFKDRFDVESKDNMGELLFHKDSLGAGVVTHEVTHMILAFLRYYFSKETDVFSKIKEQDMRYEELLCYMIGDCSSAIYKILYKNKVI